MIIKKNKVITLTYDLTVDGKLVDHAGTDNPLVFLFGNGNMIEGFEKNLKGLNEGDQYDFTVECKDAYGDYLEEAVVELDKNTFVVDGKLIEELVVGNFIPMQDQRGTPLRGKVKEIRDNTVILDFNHPLAGKDLQFKGSITGVRDATDEELEHGHVHSTDGHHH